MVAFVINLCYRFQGFKMFFYIIYYVLVSVPIYYGTCVAVRGHLVGVGPLLPPYRF